MNDEELMEVVVTGECPNCGEMEGPFDWSFVPRCPNCSSKLDRYIKKQEPKSEAILSDVTADDVVDEIR